MSFMFATQDSTRALDVHVQMLMEQLLGQTKQGVVDFLQQSLSPCEANLDVSSTYILISPKDVRM